MYGGAQFQTNGYDRVQTGYGTKYVRMYSYNPTIINSINQVFSEIPAGSYQIRYAYVPAVNNGPNTSCTLKASIDGNNGGGAVADERTVTLGQTSSYYYEVLNRFTTTDRTDTLTFDFSCTGEEAQIILLIDNVSITAVVEDCGDDCE